MIKITTSNFEKVVNRYLGQEVRYLGIVVDNYFKKIKPIKHVFLRFRDGNGDSPAVFTEEILLKLLKVKTKTK